MKTELDYMKNMNARYLARFSSFCKTKKCETCEFNRDGNCVCIVAKRIFNSLIQYLEVFENEQKGPLKF